MDKPTQVPNRGCPREEGGGPMATTTETQMIARRTAKGFRADESAALLSDLIARHSGDNLAAALVHEGFATEHQAHAYHDGFRLTLEEVDGGE